MVVESEKTQVRKNMDKQMRDLLAQAKRNSGRPITNQEIQQMLQECRKQEFLKLFFKSGGNIAFCCVSVGVTRHTFVRWKREDELFNTAVSEINEAALDIAEQQLMKNVLDGKETSLIFYLCNKGKHRGWTSLNKMENKVTVPVQINVEYADGKGSKQISVSECKPKKLRLPKGDAKAD